MPLLKNTCKRIVLYTQLFIFFISYMISGETEKKIIIGVTEIANILYNMKQIFREKSIVFCKNGNKFYQRNVYDIDLIKRTWLKKILFSAYIFGKLAKNAECFIYLWSDGFLLDREYEFKFLKKRNIPIICYFLGSEIRSRKLFLDYCKKINFNTYVEYDKPELFLSDKYDNSCRNLAEQADKYASIIFSEPKDQMSYLKSKQQYFPIIIDENLFSFEKEKFDKCPIRIIHAPSLPVLKGTPLVRSVIKMLKSECYEFKYIELIGVPHEDVVKELKQSHIVLNQFYTLIPGIFGHEAMAAGNAVLMSAKPECYPYVFNNAWVETEDWQLYYNLKNLLDNPQKIYEYAKNGYEYMIANFDHKKIKNYLAGVFKENGLVL